MPRRSAWWIGGTMALAAGAGALAYNERVSCIVPRALGLGWRTAILVAALSLSPALSAAPASAGSARQVRQQLDRALTEARRGHLDAAFLLADAVAGVHPESSDARTVRDMLQQRAVMVHLERAHNLDRVGKRLDAAVEYRMALSIDPANSDAQLGLAAQFATPGVGDRTSDQLWVNAPAPPVQPRPSSTLREFHLQAGLRQVIGELMSAYGMHAYVANDVPDVHIRIDIADASFSQAMQALRDLAAVDYVALDPHTLYFATRERMRDLQPMAVRTFYVPWVNNAADLTELTTMLRSTLALRQAQADPGERAITVRATPEQLDATERLLLDLRNPEGDVLLDVKIIEVSRSVAETLGVSDPSQFQLFSLGPLLAQLTQSGVSLQTLINEFFSSGGLNSILSGGQVPSTLLQQAESQLSPLLQQPFVTFGGGATLMALSVPSASVAASVTSSQVSTLDDAWLRAENGQVADLKIGQRYPIVSASFSPIYLSSAIAQVIGNGTLIQPFPSFTYEDLGVEVKITPRLSVNDGQSAQVHLEIETSVKALAGDESSGMPVLSDRDVVTQMTLGDGEPALMAGLLDKEEVKSLSGIPGLSEVPGLGSLFSQATPQTSRDELLIVVTPHVVALPVSSSAAIWLPPGFGANAPEEPAEPEVPLPGPGMPPTPVPPQDGRGGRGGGAR